MQIEVGPRSSVGAASSHQRSSRQCRRLGCKAAPQKAAARPCNFASLQPCHGASQGGRSALSHHTLLAPSLPAGPRRHSRGGWAGTKSSFFCRIKPRQKKSIFPQPSMALRPAGTKSRARRPKCHAPLTDGPRCAPLVVGGAVCVQHGALVFTLFSRRCGHG